MNTIIFTIVLLAKKPIDYSPLTEETETDHKAPIFKVADRVRINKCNNTFTRVCNEHWLKEIFIIDSVLETNPWMYKIKDFKGETIISFYENELLLSIL